MRTRRSPLGDSRQLAGLVTTLFCLLCPANLPASTPRDPPAPGAEGVPGTVPSVAASAELQALADGLLAEVRAESAYLRHLAGLPVTELDDLGPDAVARAARWGREQLAHLDAIPVSGLSLEDRLFAGVLRQAFERAALSEQADALTFAVTPYAGGWRFLQLQEVLEARPLGSAEERANYLHLLAELGRVIDQAAAKTKAQAARGVRVPRPALDGVVATFEGLAKASPSVLLPADERLASVPPEEAARFRQAVGERIGSAVVPAYQRLLAVFDADYRQRASEAVGLASFPGGRSLYRQLIQRYTGLDLSPEEIHQRGLAAVGDLEAKMTALRQQLGFAGSGEDFHRALRQDRRFQADTPEELEARFRRAIELARPRLRDYFEHQPAAPYDVKRLDLAAEAGMSYGYYQQPGPGRPQGFYRYNGSHLEQRSLVAAAHLIYHELIPGHHFQIARQLENHDVHPVRATLDHGAFVEGWAEYAASLGIEMGLYADPYDLYGLYLAQSFLASRLVVDTGMNDLGWSLEKARQFLRDHSFEGESQIATESLRYSTDLYAQALCYRLGYDQIWALRHRAEAALGPRFDLRAFHEAVIGSGSLPLNILAERIDAFIAERRAAR